MKRGLFHKFLLGMFMFLLFAGVFSYSANVGAAPRITMNPGQSKAMELPKGWKNVTWSSNKKAVAKIQSGGVVKAVAAGEAVITAKAGSSIKKYRIQVQQVQLSNSKVTMKTGEKRKLTAKNALDKVCWSSDGKAATVDSQGNITAVRAGKAVITASVFRKKHKCAVTVTDGGQEEAGMKMKIQVGDTAFTATLADNSSVDALRELMADAPLMLKMSDYANMEKGADLGTKLPQNNVQMNTQAGDIILYQGRTLVIYYDTNSWSLTPIGKIDNVSAEELREVLGTGDVTVTFSIE